jgi:hypothetical protein
LQYTAPSPVEGDIVRKWYMQRFLGLFFSSLLILGA